MKLKNYLFVFGLILLGNTAFSQIIFSEDFNGGSSFSGWTLINNDNRTPATNVGYVTDAWVVREDFDTTGVGDSVAVSTSWYSPAGAADDYMITPAIILSNVGYYLKFDAKAQDPAFPDGYEVLISNTTPTIAALNANTALYSTTAENATWTNRNIDLSAYGGDTVYIAWRNNSNDKFLLLIDNISVYQAPPLDAALKSLNLNNVYTNNTAVSIDGVIENNGLSTITSLEVSWTADGGTTVNNDTLALNLNSFSTTNFSHIINWTATNPGMNTDIKVWVSMPNGIVDTINGNDTLSKTVFVNNGTSGTKKVLLEEFTTAPCQFCPDGAVIVDNILATIPEAIAVGIHAGFGTDAMTIPAHSAYAAVFAPGAPTATIDRVLFDGETDVAISRGNNGWVNAVNAQKALPTPVDVDIQAVSTSGTSVDVTVDVDFKDYVLDAQSLRVTLFVVEDSVTGTGSGYNQVNFYNTQAGHPYAGKGDPIVGFVHKHVVRSVPTGTWGDATYFGTTPTLNSNYTKTYNVSLNSAWKSKDISFVAFVNYYTPNASLDEYVILNAEEKTLDELVGINENEIIAEKMQVSPNPANNYTNLTFELIEDQNVVIDILDINGKVINSLDYGTLNKGKQLISLNTSTLAKGFYFINLKAANQNITSKLVIN